MLAAVVVASGLTFGVVKFLDRLRKVDAENAAKQITEKAEREASNKLKEAELAIKERDLAQKADADKELNKGRDELRERERALDKRQEVLSQQDDDLRKQEKMVESNQRRLAERHGRRQPPQRRAGQAARNAAADAAQAERPVARRSQQAAARFARAGTVSRKWARSSSRHEKRMAEVVEQKSRDMLLTAMQRYAAAHTAESTTSTVDIPSDEMKGRIIGREGRNIRAFEKATGVDVIIDDTPGVVIVSGFDPVRREVARQSLNKLIADGRIHPVADRRDRRRDAEGDRSASSRRRAKRRRRKSTCTACIRKVLYMLGRLHFRTSYSQNVLRHSVEVAFLTGHAGRNDRPRRRHRPPLRPAARHRQSGRSRARRGPSQDRRRPAQAARREGRSRARGLRPSRRDRHRVSLHDARRHGRCLQRLAARRAPRIARALHQADGRTGIDRLRLSRASSRRLPFRPAASCA